MTTETDKTIDFGKVPTLERSLLTGGIGFGVVSLIVFATVAFGEGWMYAQLGLMTSYIAWTALFIVLGGGVLGPLVVGRWRLPGFYLLFGLAFFAYAAGWVGAYFILRGTLGEWVGSVVGTFLMGLVLAIGLRALRSTLKLWAVLFVTNSIGYFLGSTLNTYIGGSAGMLLWGTIYGFCLGCGLGAVLHYGQADSPS